GPVESDFAGHRLAGRLLERVECLARAVASRRGACYEDGAVYVEAVGVLRSRRWLGRFERGERDHGAVVVAHVELADVRGARALRSLGLQEHAPLPAEAVELVDEQTSEKRLHRLINLAERNPLLEDLVTVHVGKDLWHRHRELRRDAGQLGPLPR